MSHTLSLSDDLYQQLATYAAEHRQTAEEVLASLVQGLPTRADASESQDAASTITDPWEGFYGAFEIEPPDAIERHDEMIGREALESHDDSE